MIDPSNLMRARTVEDIYEEKAAEPDIGTKVGDDVLSTDKDTVFPLQACLGCEITQTLFVGRNTLLVEGPSDLLYLQWFQRFLRSRNRTTLSPEWTITPCGSIDKIPAFLSLFCGNRLNIAVLTDVGDGSKRRVRDLKESSLVQQLYSGGRIFTADKYAEQNCADIEDCIGRAMYREVVNECYKLPAKLIIPKDKGKDSPSRVVEEVANHFRTLPAEVANFNHFDPAVYLISRPADVTFAGLEAAAARFERIFSDINKLLATV